jgi:hypothetical protein
MKKLLGIVVLSLFISEVVLASNFSNIFGKKKNKEVTHYKCKVEDSGNKKEKDIEFGIIFGDGIDDYNYAISYSKDKKFYGYPYSSVKYFKKKIGDEIWDIKFFISLSTPEYRKDLGPNIGLHMLAGSFVYGPKQSLTTYWFNARNNTTNDQHLFEDWQELVNSGDENLDTELRSFSEKIFKIINDRMGTSSIIEIVDIEKMDNPEYEIQDWSSQLCKVKFQKISKRKKSKKSEEIIKNNKQSIVEELEKLNDLYKSGVLTKEEFEKAKKKILN